MISPQRLDSALASARNRLLDMRLPEGYWVGQLSSSAVSTAAATTALALSGGESDLDLVTGGLDWLAETQNPDGGWGDVPGCPTNPSATLLALSALRIGAGDDRPALAQAQSRAEEYVAGNVGRTGEEIAQAVEAVYHPDRTFAVPILTNCALADLVPWRVIPGLPFELAALPRSLYHILRLHVVSYALPALIAVGTLLARRNPSGNPLVRLVRRAVVPTVRRKLQILQPENGGFLEAPPLTSFVAMSLLPLFGAGDPVAAKCLAFLRASVRADGSWPIDTNLATWLTSAAVNALDESGAGEGDGLEAARDWIAQRQYREVHPFTGAAPGGWGWTNLPGAVPDADDTSGAMLALGRSEHSEQIAAGVRWLLNLQNADGGWPTFCRGWGKLPFDKSCPDITAHAMRALHPSRGLAAHSRVEAALERGLEYLSSEQRADGSWVPLWFGSLGAPDHKNPVFGTSRVLMALALPGADGELASAGLQYLTAAQNADGGWGGAVGVPSSIEETALAVCALASWPEEMNGPLAKGVCYLLSRIEEGTWTQTAPIGLYFASLWYAEQLYPVVWTVEALGRVQRAVTAANRDRADEVVSSPCGGTY